MKTTRKLLEAVFEAGERIKSLPRTATVKEGEGHRSVVSHGDDVSQRVIRSHFMSKGIRFICEEKSADPRVLAKSNPSRAFHGNVIVFDELDGTTLYADGHPEWTVGAGFMHDGKLRASAIYAPDTNGGLLCFSNAEEMTVMERGVCGHTQRIPLPSKSRKESIILRGVDSELYANITSMMPQIASGVRAVYIKGSGLFALMYLALGRAEAVIQTPQKIHDWAPAYHLVRKSGRIFRFFRLKNGALIPVGKYDFKSFTHAKENRLGFVAGSPETADWLFEALPRSGWERYDPDTI